VGNNVPHYIFRYSDAEPQDYRTSSFRARTASCFSTNVPHYDANGALIGVEVFNAFRMFKDILKPMENRLQIA